MFRFVAVFDCQNKALLWSQKLRVASGITSFYLNFIDKLAAVGKRKATVCSKDIGSTERWTNLTLESNPTAATKQGVNDFNDRLPSVTLESEGRVVDAYRALLRRARDVNRDSLSVDGLANADLLVWELEDSIGAAELQS